MDLGINGLRVIVTAGGSGIGYAIAQAFVREGAKVHICDIDQAVLDAVTVASPEITRSQCDVADRDAVSRLFADALSVLGGLDCLVNNAGIGGPIKPVQDIEPDEWDRCINVSLTGHFNCTRLAVDHIKKSQNASIINVSSAAGKFGFQNRSPYSAAKWGVIGFTKSISRELGQYGVRCNALLPGVVNGDRVRRLVDNMAKAGGKTIKQVESEWMALASVKEMISPEQLADMVLFLASPRGRTISGQAISVDSDLQALL